MSDKMGFYRMLVCVYYSKKNFVFVGFVLAVLMMVYFYLPYAMGPKPGSSYLNPRVNKLVQSPNIPQSYKADLDISQMRLVNVPDYLTELDKCPACFGKDICEDILSGAIQMIQPDDDDVLKLKGVYNGYWNKQPIVIKRLNKLDEYAKVDAFLCRNASMEPGCDVSKAIMSSQAMVQQEQGFTQEFLRGAWKIMHERSDQLAVAACMTDDGISMLSEEFDADNDGKLTAEDKAMFFTSLVLNPESLLLQFAKVQGLKIHFPEVLGRCGRIVVTEHAGQPLATFLRKDFKERADIAMMLLGMIFFLQNFSSKWSLVFSDFNYDNFYIKDNNLYIVDAEDMLVTDTEVYPEPKGPYTEVCNAECFEKFSRRLFDYDTVRREDICPLTPRVTEQAMYALACERIMSYLPEHKQFSPYEGLLHDPPVEITQFLETALRECVTETAKDGRISAIDVISEMLEKYTDYGNYHYNDDLDGDDDKDQHHGDPAGPDPANPVDAQNRAPSVVENPAPVNPVENHPAVNPVENPAAVNPVENHPAVNPVENPAAVNPVENPVAVNPVENPAALNPVQNPVENPAPINPVQNPAAVNPVENPAAVNPVQNPAAVIPVENPAPVNPVENPDAVNPVENPVAVNPVENPVAVNPVENPVAVNPVENPAAVNPVQNPAAVNPVENPAALNPVQNPVENPAVVNQP